MSKLIIDIPTGLTGLESETISSTKMQISSFLAGLGYPAGSGATHYLKLSQPPIRMSSLLVAASYNNMHRHQL